MEKNIKNKIVVVTGAARGIGLGIVKAFLKEGAKHAVVLDSNEEIGIEATNDLNVQFGADKATFFKCDVTSDLDTVFDKILSKFKTIDILVNNAGLADENSIRKTIAVNTVATVEWTMKFWDYVRKDKGRNGGTVINIASLYGFFVDPFLPFYKTSKYAVIGFTRTMGHKINYDQTGVRVIAICPGFTKTPLTDKIELNGNQKFQLTKFLNFTAKNKWLVVEELSKAITEVFRTAESGSIWSIIGGEPPKEVPVPPEFRSESLIQGEL